MSDAVGKSAEHRSLELRPLSDGIVSLVELRKRAYRQWRARLGPDGHAYPEDLGEVVAAVLEFADPLLAGKVADARWDPAGRCWRT